MMVLFTMGTKIHFGGDPFTNGQVYMSASKTHTVHKADRFSQKALRANINTAD